MYHVLLLLRPLTVIAISHKRIISSCRYPFFLWILTLSQADIVGFNYLWKCRESLLSGFFLFCLFLGNNGGDFVHVKVVCTQSCRCKLTLNHGGRADFPYVPGYLSFREAPAVLEAFAGLGCRPDVLMLDGQGIAHPRRFGLASHVGVLLDLPTVGVTNRLLLATGVWPEDRRGATLPFRIGQETVGV